MWELFNLPHNKVLKNKIFYEWLLEVSLEGTLKIETHRLNQLIAAADFKIKVFDNLIKRAEKLKYSSMTVK